jgi:Acetyltransferases
MAEIFSPIREITSDDRTFLAEMCALAVFPRRSPQPDLGLALRIPQLNIWLKNWGRCGDDGVIAIGEDGTALGAAWYRLFASDDPAPGFLDASIPVMVLAVRSTYQHQGIGRRLLEALKMQAKQHGYSSLSLGVAQVNAALRFYTQMGCVPVEQYGHLLTMSVPLVASRYEATSV